MTTTNLDALLAADLTDEANRLVLSDAMEDAGRMGEAAILRGGEDGMLPVVVCGGEVFDRCEALNRFSTARVFAAYVSETYDAGQPVAFTDVFGCVWDVDSDDGVGNLAVTRRHKEGSCDPAAGVAKWMVDAPFVGIRFAREGETFGVNNPDELVCLGNVWEANEIEPSEDE